MKAEQKKRRTEQEVGERKKTRTGKKNEEEKVGRGRQRRSR